MQKPRFPFWPVLLVVLVAIPSASAQVRYQILLKGGHDYRTMKSDYGIRDVDKIIRPPK